MLGSNCSIDITENILDKQDEVDDSLRQIDMVRNFAGIGSIVTTGTSLARKSKYFQKMHQATNDKVKMRNFLMAEHEEMLEEVNRLPQESKDRLNAVLEYLRLSATDVRDTGRSFSIKTRDIEQEGRDGITRTVKPALSTPGDVLSLTKAETVKLHQIRNYLDDRYTLNGKSMLAAVGYTGEYGRDAIMSEVEDEQFRSELLRLFDAIERQRLTSYIPFMRSGDKRIMVYGPDGTIDSGAFYMLDSMDWAKDLVGPLFAGLIPDPDVNAKIKEIQDKYPAEDGFKVVVTPREGDVKKRLTIDDLTNLDKLLNLMDARSGDMIKNYFDKTLGGMFDAETLERLTNGEAAKLAKGFIGDLDKNVRSVLMEDLIAGFMKQSRNIPGYDTNFTDKLLDYNRIIATTVSHRMYREEYAKAFDDVIRYTSKPEQDYAKRWDKYVDSSENAVWRAARTLGFFTSMWGSFSSSAVNAMSVWTVTAPQMTVMKMSAGLDIYKTAVQVMAGFRGAVGYGLHVDPYAIPGITEDERDALILANKRGTVRAQMNPELMGVEAGMNMSKSGKFKKAAGRYFQYGASVVSVTEEMNKAAAFIVAYRYAKDAKALANWKKAFADNERAKAIIEKGSDPFDVAEFMVETVTFMGGQIEKPPIMRGAGGAVFQFSQYPLQISKLLVQNFAKQGARGRIAGMFTLMTMFTVSGLLFAIPFGDDAINIFEFLTEAIWGKKRDFRTETQQMLADYLGSGEEGRRDAETIMRGPFRSLLGLNIGERIGFTAMAPEFGDPVSVIPALSGTLGKFNEYRIRKASGVQPVAANVALASIFVGKGVSDILKGMIQFPAEGYRTRYGTKVLDPEDISTGERIMRAAGFQTADIARAVQAVTAGKELATSTDNAERNVTLRLSKGLADAIRAEKKGNTKEAERLRAKFDKDLAEVVDDFQKDIEAGRMKGAIKPPSSMALKEAVVLDLYPEMRVKNIDKLKRPAYIELQRDILVEDDEDSLLPDEEEEDESSPYSEE
jgi:hypothetical protein